MENRFEIVSDFTEYKKLFLVQNGKHNLISKRDEEYLFEKHIYDSLAIKLFFTKYGIDGGRILDIGCGGGFPSLPIAIELPRMKVTGIDSIRKKINSVNLIKEGLGLSNAEFICTRAEEFGVKDFDIVTSRAVGELGKIAEYALDKVKRGGYFVAYKSRKAAEEIEKASGVLSRHGAKVVDIIEYGLPLEKVYTRNLVCIKKLG